ncbi:MAG: hypothetical protein VKK04_02715 [Synechococcales bacterium]|nr:hypothetical protein [Synechococcales bacterium]
MKRYFAEQTGRRADVLFGQLGMSEYRIRYNGKEIRPTPLVSDRQVQANADMPFQLSQAEQLRTYGATIPDSSLRESLGGDYAAALLPDAAWEISTDQGQSWIAVTAMGEPLYAAGGAERWGFTFVEAGIR